MRTGSTPITGGPAQGLLKISLGDHDTVTGILFAGKNHATSPRSSLHYHYRENKNKKVCSTSIRRSFSETDMFGSFSKFSRRRAGAMTASGSKSFPGRIMKGVEEEEEEEEEEVLILKKNIGRSRVEVLEEVEFSGGGSGSGRKIGGGGGADLSGGNAKKKMGEYYQEMLKANPGNALLLRNYGQYLHVVVGDLVKAEECYQRAILASPGDGEVLCLYGNLIWDVHRDGERATFYFDQAVQASPDDCFVRGSYANFLWNSEADDEEDERQQQMEPRLSHSMVQAF